MIRLFALALLASASPALAADLTIQVTHIRDAKGEVRIAVYDTASDFPEGEQRWSRDVAAQAPDVTVTVADVPPGRYAVAVYHDENADGVFATNLFGWPLEGYGFSRDARVVLSPPTFDAAAVEVPADGARIAITMRY